MSKKILLLSLSSFGLLFFAATGRAIPFSAASTNLAGAIRSQVELAKSNIVRGKDSIAQTAIDKLLTEFSGNEHIAEAVCKVADQYYQLRRHQKADKLYQRVVNNWPDSEHAMWARMHLTLSHIAKGEQTQAQTACEKLITDFPEHKYMASAICQIADNYHKSGEYEKAIELYQHIADNWPDAEHAMWAQMHLTLSHIAKGEQTQAKAAYRKLVANFSNHKFLVNGVMQITENYCDSGRAKQACEFFRDAIDKEPQAEHMIWSQMGLAMSSIALGDDAGAQTVVDKLVADFSGNRHIVNALCHVADGYRKSEKHEKAHELYQYIVNTWPEAEYAMWAQMHLAIYISSGAQATYKKLIANYSGHEEIEYAVYQVANSYRKSGRHENAIKLYQYVIDHWPDCEYNWSAQCLIGCCYEGLRDEGLLSESEANTKIEEAYKKVIQNYPNCGLTNHASIELGRMKFNEANWSEAAMYFEIFIDKCDYDNRVPYVLEKLGQSYEQMGQLEAAIQVYSTFIESSEPNERSAESVSLELKELEAQVK